MSVDVEPEMDFKALEQAVLLSEQMMAGGDHYDLHVGKAVVFSTKSPDKDTPNEDSAILFPVGPSACVLAVADGAGGLRGGAKASNIAVETLKETLTLALADGTSLREAILNAFEQADARIKALGLGAATTMAVVEVNERSMRSYHVGDSVILVAGQRGKVKWQTISHSPVGYAIEAGVLDQEEAMYHKDRHLVSNFLGQAEMRIDMGPALPLSDLDTIVIASDGLSDNLNVDEIVTTVRLGALDKASVKLAASCRDRMQGPRDGQPSKPDDLTFILFRLQKPVRRASQKQLP